MSKKNYYVTAAIPYVNAPPHIGHALEYVQTDTIKRYQSLLGKNAMSLSGGDENALKNVQAAQKAGIPIQKFIDKNTELFRQLAIKLNGKFDLWGKGSDQKHHYPSSQKLWKLCLKDIYKKHYKGKYCVGCASFLLAKDLDENKQCHEHPGKKLDEVSEQNYFFALSKYEIKLANLIKKDRLKIYPENRKNEVLAFINQGLKDISVSRSNKRAKDWGIPVPNDDSQRIYVWFDALNIYASSVGFGWDDKKYANWWPADLHVIGKGILRFHAIYWPAFLLSAGLKLPKAIFVHDYFTVDGQKMSKTIGNVVDPVGLIDKYTADPVRYYFLAKFNPFTDGDFSIEKFEQVYNADLANGLGNLVARVAKLAEITKNTSPKIKSLKLSPQVVKNLNDFRFDRALEYVWQNIASLDKQIDKNKLWENTLAKKDVLASIISSIQQIAYDLQPFLPQTAQKIIKQFKGPKIKSNTPLFPRIK